MTIRSIFLLLLFVSTSSGLAVAQGLTERRAEKATSNLPELRSPINNKQDRSDLEAVKVEQRVKPAFIINPLVHRLTARRGQLLNYEFDIEANARPTRLEIYPVAMLQQEHGVIMPDPAAVPPGVVQLLTPSTVSLQVGESHKIRCQMRIPPVNAPFLSYGVLVKELPPDETKNGGDATKPNVGIRFLTQYLLRTDIHVLGVPGDSVRNWKWSRFW